MPTMAKKKNSAASAAAAVLGRIGGRVPGRKGFATLTSAERKAAGERGAIARWGKKQKALMK